MALPLSGLSLSSVDARAQQLDAWATANSKTGQGAELEKQFFDAEAASYTGEEAVSNLWFEAMEEVISPATLTETGRAEATNEFWNN